jgi:nicotinamide mononucleotide transporter
MVSLMEAIQESVKQFLTHTSPLEWCGVISGILCVWLAAKNNIFNWPVAIVSVLIYTVIFFETRLYSEVGLQIYFLFMNVYGWYYWTKNKNSAEPATPVSMINKNEIILSILGIILFTVILGSILHYNTFAAFPYLDSFCTACSLIAQIFLARKVLQNWLIWIFVDVIYVGVFISKNLYPTALMYTLYIYIAWVGYRDWKKTYTEAHD